MEWLGINKKFNFQSLGTKKSEEIHKFKKPYNSSEEEQKFNKLEKRKLSASKIKYHSAVSHFELDNLVDKIIDNFEKKSV